MRAFASACVLVLVLAACAACDQPGPTAAGRSSAAVVASVNGVAITEAEVQQGLKPSAHGAAEATAERRQAVIAGLVREELIRQRAVELGLEPEGPGAEEVARLEALLAGARRKALIDAWYRQQIVKKAEPTEQEARAYFEANLPALRTEVQLWQMLMRDEAQLAQAQREVQAGAPFEEVARRQFPALPEAAGRPWELGFLSFRQLPEPWRPVVAALEPGAVSPIIRGPGGRFWLLKLIERRVKAEVTFEEVRAQIVEDLRRARVEQLSAQAERELRRAAKVIEP